MIILPPPQIIEGSTNYTGTASTTPWAVQHAERPSAGFPLTERYVIYDRSAFLGGADFRARRAPASQQGSWATVRNALFAARPVQAYAQFTAEPKAPPASAFNLGETGRFMTFRLKVGTSSATMTDAGGLLRIQHADGTLTDHWALWANWHDVDDAWSMEGTRVPAGTANDFQSLQDFLTFHLSRPASWCASPLRGSWVHISKYALRASDS